MCNLAQEGSVDSALSAAFSLKHMSTNKRSRATRESAQTHLSQVNKHRGSQRGTMQDTPMGKYIVQVEGKSMKPMDCVSRNVSPFLQLIKAELAESEVSCVIDQDDKGRRLIAHPVGSTTETQKTAYTFAHMAIQTTDIEDHLSCPMHTKQRCSIGKSSMVSQLGCLFAWSSTTNSTR